MMVLAWGAMDRFCLGKVETGHCWWDCRRRISACHHKGRANGNGNSDGKGTHRQLRNSASEIHDNEICSCSRLNPDPCAFYIRLHGNNCI